MKKRACFFFVINCLTLGLLYAQTDSAGSLTINADERIEGYIEKRTAEKLTDSLQKGFRIQIIITDKRNDARAAKEKFANKYPNCPSYVIFDSPHFKVRIGDFKTRLEAQALLFALTEDFPTLFLVEEKINPPSLAPCY